MDFVVTQRLKFGLKTVLLMVFIYLTNHGFLPRLQFLIENNNTSTITVFIILWGLSLLTLLIATFQQQWLIRLFWAVLIAGVTGISYGFYAAGGSELEVLDVLELWQARHETGRALEFFQHALIKAAIVSLIGFIIIIFPPPLMGGKARKFLSHFMWIPFLPVFLFIALIFIKSDQAVAGLPQQFVPLSIVGAVAYKLSTNKLPVRDKVLEAPKLKPKMQHLVYLVDESINPHYLYESKGKLLKGLDDNKAKITNFGVAVSGGNCSARSNAILRLGATRDNLIETIRTSPTLWQYAKKAGFRTVYIDAQDSSKINTKPNDYQNYMTGSEAKFIDEFYKIKGIKTPQLDFHLLELIKTELENEAPTFIYANKNGAHFPYNDNYPISEAIHQPIATVDESRGGLGELMNLYQNSGLEGVINAYKNSVHWTVDLFFRKFFQQIDLHDTVVIYTSDHGQYFEISSTTHCTSGDGAPAIEGLVPLMLFTDKPSLKQPFSDAAKVNYNQADQFSIFPTVLNFLGYSEKQQQVYGPNLLDKNSTDVAAFNTGDIMGILSNETVWREVSKQERINLMPNVPITPLHQ